MAWKFARRDHVLVERMQGAGRGRGAGETVELDWWEGRADEQERRAKYGFWDWKGEFIEGEVPPMYYSGELPGPRERPRAFASVGGMPLSRRLWGEIEDVYAAILEHPFLRGLQSGELPREAFLFYVIQDAHYLRDYARALAVCAARAPAEADIQMFAEHAAGAIAVERELHEGFFADAGIGEAEVAATPMAPTCLAYTSYLLASVYGGSFAEALGAVLPCYWIYQEVGTELARRGSPDPLYQRWIDTYGGEEFAAVVRAVIELTDGLEPSAADTERMGERFRTTARYEWMFWDMGWRREGWPV